MAQRRMFSKSITNSSQFLMMPQSSQNLYFHLGMNADDDGFCEHFSLMRMTDSKPDDLKILQAKGFVTVFDDKVLVISDWKENNYLRSDRYTPSKYLAIYKDELDRLSSGIPLVDEMATQVRLGKDSKGKVRIDNTLETSTEVSELNLLMDLFVKSINPTLSFGNKTQRSALQSLVDKFGLKKTTEAIKYAISIQGTKYSPTITTPVQLLNKYGELQGYYVKNNKSNVITI